MTSPENQFLIKYRNRFMQLFPPSISEICFKMLPPLNVGTKGIVYSNVDPSRQFKNSSGTKTIFTNNPYTPRML
jgi:hypothetical protein